MLNKPVLRSLAGFALLSGSALLGLELLARLLFPDMTYASLSLRLRTERATWARADPEFHHIGDDIYGLNFPEADEAGPARIMVVGDSFAMGHGVGADRRFGALLQQSFGATAKIDVLASTSYSPIIYRNIIRKAFALATYRAVAVYVDQTDPADELIYDEDVVEDGTRTFDVFRMLDRQKAVDEAYREIVEKMSGPLNMRQSTVYNVLQPHSLAASFKAEDKYFQYIVRSLSRGELIQEFTAEPNSKQSRRMAELLVNRLDQIVSLCQSKDVPLLLLTNPWEFQTSPRPRITLKLTGPFPKVNRLEALIEGRYGSMSGVYVVPMTERYREQPEPSKLYIDHPGHEFHWNEAGHVLAEKVIREQLLNIIPVLKPR